MVRVTGVTEDKADIAQKNFVYARLFLSVGPQFLCKLAVFNRIVRPIWNASKIVSRRVV